MIGSQNPDDPTTCDCSLFNSPVLRSGCENFRSLKWDNPAVSYEEVACPDELSRLHCSHPYVFEPDGMPDPDTCSSNAYESEETTTTEATTTVAQTTSTTVAQTTSTTVAQTTPPQTTTTTVPDTTTSTTVAQTTQPPQTTQQATTTSK